MHMYMCWYRVSAIADTEADTEAPRYPNGIGPEGAVTVFGKVSTQRKSAVRYQVSIDGIIHDTPIPYWRGPCVDTDVILADT